MFRAPGPFGICTSAVPCNCSVRCHRNVPGPCNVPSPWNGSWCLFHVTNPAPERSWYLFHVTNPAPERSWYLPDTRGAREN